LADVVAVVAVLAELEPLALDVAAAERVLGTDNGTVGKMMDELAAGAPVEAYVSAIVDGALAEETAVDDAEPAAADDAGAEEAEALLYDGLEMPN
jgi:hypothetical protein